MRPIATLCLASAAALVPACAAQAIVGPSQSCGGAAAHTVMVLKRQARSGSFCSGVVVAPRVVLTAAHCVARAEGVAIHLPGSGNRALLETAEIAIHPGFVPDAIRKRVRTIDLALLRFSRPLPGGLRPAALSPLARIRPGMRFRVAGFGVRRENDDRTAGRLRTATIAARKPVSRILLWAHDPGGKGLGACTGDSGGPVFAHDFSAVVAITTWARGRGRRGCGELTQAVLVAPQRAWIEKILQRWGAR